MRVFTVSTNNADPVSCIYMCVRVFTVSTDDNTTNATTQVLKRKKMYESQRDQLAAQSFNVDQVWMY